MPVIHRRRKCIAIFLAMTLTGASASRAATAAEVDTALKKAIDFLYTKQSNGNWETVATPQANPLHDSVEGGQWGGLTGIATYALLAAEQDPQDKRILKAVDFLQNAKLRGVYAISMRSQVWPFMGHARSYHDAAVRDAKLLMGGARTKGVGRGLWFYYIDEPTDERTDHSASQFALLGVWACEEAGVEIPTTFWKLEDTVWRRDQMPGGGWAYVYQDTGAWGEPYLSMTCAGLASLFITQEKLVTVASRCKPLPPDTVVDSGINFVAKHFPTDFDAPPPNTWTPGAGKRQMYLLFGLSRLGLASGLRYFGDRDRFRTGADYLVHSQRPDGSWGDTWETAFGVLFLARGRAPVAFNKLEYESGDKAAAQTWNVRPRDMANLAAWMGQQLERRINWQVVDITTNPLDWLDAPVLYISGSEELKLSADQIAKLRQFVESGGLIVGNADCGSTAFVASFRKIGQQMFPAYQFADLPPNHPIFTLEQYGKSKWKTKPRVLSLSNGVRELMMICPDADLSKSFATQSDRSKPEHYQLGVDLYEYMAGLDLRRRGDNFWVISDPAIHATRTVHIARLKYAGNWNPEPGGWLRFSGLMHNQDKLDITTEPAEISGKLDGYVMAELTGTTAVTLNHNQQAALIDYVNAGGTLLVDAAGGHADFAISMEQQLNVMFGSPLTLLPPESPLYLSGDAPMTKFAYSRYARSTMGNLKSPRVKAITVKGRPAVFFSAEDLSLGMVGQPVDGVIGYAPDTAIEIVRRIVLSTQAAK